MFGAPCSGKSTNSAGLAYELKKDGFKVELVTEFAKELHSEMEKVVLMDELPENWTYPLIQPKLIEKYLQMKNFVDDTL